MTKNYYKYLAEYFRVEIKFIKRFRSGGWQKRYQAKFIETEIKISTQKNLKTILRDVRKAQRDAINQSLNLGEQMVLF